MNIRIILISLFSILTFRAIAQPRPEWERFIDGGRNDYFIDVYITETGDFIACGNSQDRHGGGERSSDFWISRISSGGERIWSNSYGEDDVHENARSIIQTDAGGFLAGGYTSGDGMTAILTEPDGDEIWICTYGGGTCRAIIELKSGEYVLAGSISVEDNTQGYLVCINGNGDVLWQENYEGGGTDVFYALRETTGGIVVAGYSLRRPEPNKVFLIKTDFNGELIWSRQINVGNNPYVRDMTSDCGDGFAIVGFDNVRRSGLLLKVDSNGREEWHRHYRIEDDEIDQIQSINRFADGGYALVGTNMRTGFIVKVDAGGNENWRRSYGNGLHYMFSSVTCWDQSTLAAGYDNNGESGYDGLLVKLIPERSAPIILEYNPPQLVFTTLPNVITFDVYAIDHQDDSLRYLWSMDEEELDTDSTVTIEFEDFGVYNLHFSVSDSELSAELQWQIHVTDFFIRSTTPDSLNFSIRRGTNIDFSVDAVAVEDREISYNWMLTDRNRQEQVIGETESVSFMFNMADEHEIKVTVTYGEISEDINWIINVRSSVYSWWPSQLEVNAYVDSTQEFIITPFNENSDSLEFTWLLDDEQLESDSMSVIVTFTETGQNEVTSIVHDGIEADTVRWVINVEEWSFTADDTDCADLPNTPELYPASPNPFNSSLKLSMYLPGKNQVRLSIFDINGREVSRLIDGKVTAGNRTIVWNANDFPAGVYVVRMDAGNVSEMQKVVLVR